MRPVSFLAVPLLLMAVPAGAAEATRTLRAELEAAPGQAFAVENLAGSMRVVTGGSEKVEVVATVHAESDALAGALRLEQVTDEKGRPALRVRYPLDRYQEYRYPGASNGKGRHHWFDGGHHSRTKYDGYEHVTVSSAGGVLLYADVEVHVPRRPLQAVFRNVVGPLEGSGLDGDIRFDTGSGNVALEDSKGDLVADTGSGDVKAKALEGRFTCDTGSGNCEVVDFRGERLRCDTGSGEVEVRGASAGRIELDTGSGDVRLIDSEADEVDADTGSGSVELQAGGKRLTRLKADTGSGDVRLRLGPDASFEAIADMGSGDIISRYPDAQPIVRKREVIGYRRGSAQTRISVDTGSGDLILEPGGNP